MSLFGLGQNQAGIESFKVATQAFFRRERPRRNCLTETTRTRRRRRALIRSRSRLRSSSRVTKYCDWPTMAASKISLSSGSRHIFRSPEIWTTFARAAISRRNVSTSSGGYLNRRVNRGRLRTSAISALRLHLGPRLSHFRLDEFLWNRFGAGSHPTEQAFEVLPPLRLSVESHQDLGLLFQPKGLQRPQHSIFVHGSKRFFRRTRSSRLCHNRHYSGAVALRSSTSPRGLTVAMGDLGWRGL